MGPGAGLVLFLTGSLGARLGFVVLPFDPHHVIGQLGGLLLALFGVTLASRR
jgi:hypothetical protein